MKEEEYGLIRKIQQGKRELYRDLIERHRSRVYAVALKITGNPADAEDLAQDAFIRAYQALPGFRFQSSFSTWLYRITVNLGLDWKRRRRCSPLSPEAEALQTLPAASGLPEPSLLDKEVRENVRTMVWKLPEKYRLVLTYYYLNDYSYDKIADVLGIKKKAVETRLYRARKMLQSKGKRGMEP
ncbi:RNA polymerase sigma factor [Salinithrix halophila]|uniref:RNA polymerase sigma factor n=1 Tax=Salinithrix halophila TaxID=1485204 RepID=A0ABV8JE43_9BACL